VQESESHLKQTAILTTTSLLSILFMTFHLTDDIVFKMAPPGLANLFAVLIFVVWLYGTLALAEQRVGYFIIFLGSLLGLVVPVVHMKGAGGVVGGKIGKSSEAFFFVWTLLALGVTAMFSAVLSGRALVESAVAPATAVPHARATTHLIRPYSSVLALSLRVVSPTNKSFRHTTT